MSQNRELIVSIQTKMDGIPFSRLYTKLQVELPKLSWHALLDLDEMLGEVEQMSHPKLKTIVTGNDYVPTYAKDDEDDCPECNGGEVYEGEADVSSCGRCEGTGTLS